MSTMLMYEGRTLLSEKPAVVLDIGHAYTKCGFAGEQNPRFIIKSEVSCKFSGKAQNIYHYRNADELYNNLVSFVHILYFKYLLVTPKDRKVVIVESVFTPTLVRETLAEVLFVHYDIQSVLLAPSHLVSIYTLAVPTALVLDVGYKEAVLIPIYENTVILSAYQALALAGESVDKSLRAYLDDQPADNLLGKKSEPLSDDIVEDIKVKTCFITTLERAQIIQASQKESSVMPPAPPPNVLYPCKGEKFLNIPGAARECCYEILFEMDNDLMSIATMILDSIKMCPIDTRQTLAENIFVIGGTSMALGFKARLQQELMDLLVTSKYLTELNIKNFCFHQAPCLENCTAWLGGAILGSANLFHKLAVTKENFMKQHKLPDWSDLSFNSKDIDPQLII